MKIALIEIWDFLLLTEKEEKGWSYALNAGKVQIKNITLEMMQELKKDENFDTELLPSLFTFREILWQPDVFTEVSSSLPPLRILKAFCIYKKRHRSSFHGRKMLRHSHKTVRRF